MAYSSISSLKKYDVFLSFRGEDTRNNFVSHLYAALLRRNIRTYMDDYGLERGDEISQALEKAIENSKVSIVIFSKKYASSSWCLDELVHILQCQKRNRQIVVPVFYHVDPSHVRRQRGDYAAGFALLEERFKDRVDKVHKWRNALAAATVFAGWDSRVIRLESKLVERIVEDILEKLNCIPVSDDLKGFVGIDSRIEKIESLLCIGGLELRSLGIWGIGGVGKTTLAQFVFNRLSSQFEGRCFLANVREEWEKGRKKHQLRNKLFSTLLEEESQKSNTLLVGPTFHKVWTCKKSVLIVLDDVDDAEQLEFLIGDHDWFGFGSRIIVTTRDKQVVRNEVDEIYKVERLNYDEALLLFQSNAFKRNPPTKDILHLSEKVINYAEGIPLALKVLGAFFRGKRQDNWESELNKLKECPNKTIQDVLRISFDVLDKKQKRIFLDIACFFKGMCRDYVERILDGCGLFAKAGVDDLIDKSLITIKDDNVLWMHDMVQEMAWEIVKSTEDPGKRSRLWLPQDVYHVFKTMTGTATIEGVVLDMSELSELHLSPLTFRNMYNLRLLKIFRSNIFKKCRVYLHSQDHLQVLPDSLVYLQWDKYPWRYLPSYFTPHNLVELNLPYSKVKQLWEGKQHLPNLKKIDLSYSKHLTKIPDLSLASRLEHIYLEYCTNLRQIPSCFQQLDELKTLLLKGCSTLRNFPKLPKNIRCLVLSGTAIEQVPSSIMYLSHLEILNLRNCKRLASLPNLSKPMRSLKAIEFYGTMIYDKILWWIYDVAQYHQVPKRYDFPWSYRLWLTLYGKICLRRCSKHKTLPELPLYYLHKRGCMSIETVSISRMALTQYGDELKVYGKELLFYNCLELYWRGLNYDTADLAKLKVLSSEVARLNLKGFPIEADIGVCRVGNEIPKWFRYRFEKQRVDEKSFLAVAKLPPHSLNTDFWGFSICAALDFGNYYDYYSNTSYKLLCKSHFITSDGSLLSWDSYYEDYECAFSSLSNPMFDIKNALLGGTREDWENIRDKIIAVSFEFWCADQNYKHIKDIKVKKCGIRLLYVEDAIQYCVVNQDDCKSEEEEEYYVTSEEPASKESRIMLSQKKKKKKKVAFASAKKHSK